MPSSPPYPETPEPGAPQQFGRYRIEKELGKGAMGVVYLAEDTQLGRKVALKIPKPSILEESDALERFYQEARSAATLRHTNICPMYDVGEIDGKHFLTMAYIPGKPISSFLGKGKLPAPRQVALLIRKIALALDEAHRHGIVHRDLKPSNVMLDDRGEPIVMDFGLARQINTPQNARLTQSGALLGTPAYMSPEQVQGDLNQVGPLSDIYALGVILFQLLTGELPFSGPVMLVFAKIVRDEPAKPSSLRPDVDPALESLCLKMMAKVPAQRFASMKEVAAAVTDYLKASSATGTDSASSPSIIEPNTIPPISPENSARRTASIPQLIRSRRAIVVAALLLLCGGLIFIFQKSNGSNGKDGPPDQAIAPNQADAEHAVADESPAAPGTHSDIPESIQNPDFADDFAGWTKEGKAADFRRIKVSGRPILTTFGKSGDKTTGRLYQQFRVPSDAVALKFSIHGGRHPALSISLRDGEKTLHRAAGRNSKTSSPVSWDLRELRGKIVTFEIIDHHIGGWGFIAIHGLRMERETDVAAAEEDDDEIAAPTLNYAVNENDDFLWNLAQDTGWNPGPARKNHWQTGTARQDSSPSQKLLIAPPGNELGCIQASEDIYTDELYGDIRVQLEFLIPAGSNSGVFLMGEYEIDIDDSNSSGQIPGGPAPQAIARRPAGQWQSFDIAFQVPRFNSEGEKTKNARLSSVHYNEILIHQDVELSGPSSDPSRLSEVDPETGPLLLQGSAGPVVFRNIRISPLTPTAGDDEDAEPASGTDMFNGRDLAGWTIFRVPKPNSGEHQPATTGWTWDQGEIICNHGNNNGWLRYDTAQSDFELSIEFQLPPQVNTGVLVRYSGAGPLNLKPESGLEIQLENDSSQANPKQKCGAIFGHVAPTADAYLPNQWNSLQVRCERDEVSVELNGRAVVNTSGKEVPVLKSVPARGFIGLSNWQGRAQGARFRNIRLASLSNSPADPGVAPADSPPVTTPNQDVPDADGWITLFNGKSRDGWKHFGLQGQGNYQPIDGVLKKKDTRVDRGLLAHRLELANFVLQLDYRLTSIDDILKIFLRLHPQGNRPPTNALAIQLIDNRTDKQGGRGDRKRTPEKSNGALFNLIGPQRPFNLPFGDWHHLEVRAVGPKIAVKIDDQTVLDSNLKQIKGLSLDSEAWNESGVIGFQNFNGQSELRNIRVQRLDEHGLPVKPATAK